MLRTDDEIRELAIVMQGMAVMDGITTLTNRMSSMRMHNTKTLAIVRKPNRLQALGTPDHVGPYEVSPGYPMAGRAFSIIVLAGPMHYDVTQDQFERWFNSSVRTRLEPGGIIVEAH